jgi:hypothetical protein
MILFVICDLIILELETYFGLYNVRLLLEERTRATFGIQRYQNALTDSPGQEKPDLCLLSRFIENASIHVYTFFVLYQSLLETIAWFIMFSRSNHQLKKWAKSTSDWQSLIFSKKGDLYLNLSKHNFSLQLLLYCSVTKDASSCVL